MSDESLLHALISSYYELESEIKPLEDSQAAIRQQIQQEVERIGGRVTIKGLASVMISAPSSTVSFNAKELDTLIAELITDGEVHTAHRIAALRTVSTRAGSLRITREKK